MTGLGTIVNVIVIIIGGLIGLMLKNGLKQRFCDIFSQACGLSVVFVGAAGAFELILSVHDGKLSSNHTLLVVLSFVIGGSDGLAKEVKDRADVRLSFSEMTFPHQLMRIILLEQIYRAFTINNNIKYHK